MSSTGSIPKHPPSPSTAHHGPPGTSDPVVSRRAGDAMPTSSQHSDLPQAGSPSRPIADQGNTVRTQRTQKGDGAVAGTQKESRTNGACAEGSGSGRGGRGGGEQARGGGGDASGTRSTFMASELTLVAGEGGPSVEDRLRPTLEAAEKALIPALRATKMYRWATDAVITTLMAMSVAAYIVAATATGRQANTAILVFACVLVALSSSLFAARVDYELKKSLLRIYNLEKFIRDLKAFMLEHRRDTLSMVGPEVKAQIAWHERCLDQIIH